MGFEGLHRWGSGVQQHLHLESGGKPLLQYSPLLASWPGASKTVSDKFTQRDLEIAVDNLALCKESFWAAEAGGRASVMLLLAKLCNTKRELNWLVEEVVNKIGTWPGPKELRGIFCTKFDPADGIDAWCSLPGYRPSDGEQRALEAHEQIKAGGYLSEPAKEMLSIIESAKAKRKQIA